jgi:membrane-associated phospholipid phosphatase
LDYSLYKAVNGLSGGAVSDGIFEFLANNLSTVMVALVAALFLVPWRRRRLERRYGAIFATAAAGLALLVDQPIAHAVDRVRPYIAHPGHAHLLIARSHDPSFPSDHAAGAFAIAVAVMVFDRVFGAAFLALAVVLAFARVYVGTHYPGDVAGGAAVGALAALALVWFPPARRALEALARACSALWDRLIRVAPRTRPARPR